MNIHPCTVRLLIFSAITLFIFDFSTVFAAATTADQAEEVVSGWLKSTPKPIGVSIGHEIKSVDTFKDDVGVPLYFVVNIKPTGFVIVSANDLIEPIISFSSSGAYTASSTNPLGALVSRDLQARSAVLRGRTVNRNVPSATPSQSKWLALIAASNASVNSRGSGVLTDIRVGPLVQSLWSQESVAGAACYNYYTPNGPAGNPNNYVCGCVATAMAQLMRYHQYPVNPNSTGPLPYMITSVPQPPVSLRGGDGSGGPYNWGLMELV